MSLATHLAIVELWTTTMMFLILSDFLFHLNISSKCYFNSKA